MDLSLLGNRSFLWYIINLFYNLISVFIQSHFIKVTIWWLPGVNMKHKTWDWFADFLSKMLVTLLSLGSITFLQTHSRTVTKKVLKPLDYRDNQTACSFTIMFFWNTIKAFLEGWRTNRVTDARCGTFRVVRLFGQDNKSKGDTFTSILLFTFYAHGVWLVFFPTYLSSSLRTEIGSFFIVFKKCVMVTIKLIWYWL